MLAAVSERCRSIPGRSSAISVINDEEIGFAKGQPIRELAMTRQVELVCPNLLTVVAIGQSKGFRDGEE
jgi:hypothetical protein